MYQLYHPQSHYGGVSFTEMSLTRENALLNEQVDLLIQQNRRLKTQIIERNYLDQNSLIKSVHRSPSYYIEKNPKRSVYLDNYYKKDGVELDSSQPRNPHRQITSYSHDAVQGRPHFDKRKIHEHEISYRKKSAESRYSPERNKTDLMKRSNNINHSYMNIRQQQDHPNPQRNSLIPETKPHQFHSTYRYSSPGKHKKTNIVYLTDQPLSNNKIQSPGFKLLKISKRNYKDKLTKKKYLQLTSQSFKQVGNRQSGA